MVNEIQALKLSDIRTDGGTQSRLTINLGTVKEYAEKMTDGIEFDAIEVYHDGAAYFLVDGFHRVAAAKHAGLDTIKAAVIAGSLREAVLYSKGVNSKHGLHRTIKDKQNIVTSMLQDPEWVQWSDRAIARHIGVSNTFVGELRGKLIPKPVNVDSEKPRNYTNKHGNKSTMRTGNIGKSPSYSKSEDDYIPEVPEDNRDEQPARLSALPPSLAHSPVKPFGTRPANPPPGQTPAASSISGTAPTGGQAPYVPGYGDGTWSKRQIPGTDCWDIYDLAGNRIFAAVDNAIANKVVVAVNTSGRLVMNEPTPEELGERLGIESGDIVDALTEYGDKRVTAALQYVLTLAPVKNGYMAMMKILTDGKTLMSDAPVKPEKVVHIPASKMTPMKNAFLKHFNWSFEKMDARQKKELTAAAHFLCEQDCNPAHVFYGHRYCKGRFENNFGPQAVAKWYVEWVKTIPAAPVIPAAEPQEPYVPMPEWARDAYENRNDLFETIGN